MCHMMILSIPSALRHKYLSESYRVKYGGFITGVWAEFSKEAWTEFSIQKPTVLQAAGNASSVMDWWYQIHLIM